MGSYIRAYTDGGGIRHCPVPDDYSGLGSQIFAIGFPGFRRSLLASLVTSSTASRTSGVVTITATAHGITTGSAYVGARFFYPGSPNLAAGWYDSILSVPDANTITFSAPGADFTSESINAGAAYTTETTVWSGTLPANTLIPGAELFHRALKSCTSSVNNHFLKCKVGAGNIFHSANPSTTSGNSWSVGYCAILDNGKAAMVSGSMASGNSGVSIVAIDFTVDQSLNLTLQLSAVSEFICILTSTFEVLK